MRRISKGFAGESGSGLIGGKSTLAENYDIELVGALTRSLEIGARVEEIRPLLSASFSESVIYIYMYIYNLLSPVEHHRRKKVGRVDNGEE